MNIKEFISGRRKLITKPEQKQSAVARLLGGTETLMLGLNEPRWSGRDYASLADEGYRKNVITHRAVRIIAESAASVPLRLFRGKYRKIRRS